MRIGSLFSGIGGLELGLEWAGVGHTVWQVEREPFCLDVLAKHWPEAKRFTDVREVGAHNLEPVDVICGGFPCQDISAAGRGAGIAAGTRSGLWYEFRRVVEETRPQWVVVENVSALTGAKHRAGLNAVLGGLRSLGYCGERSVFPAADVGSPQKRERVFIVAYAERQGREGSEPHNRVPRGPCQAHPVLRDRTVEPWLALDGNRGSLRSPDGFSVAMERRRIHALGNAVVPQVAEVVGRRLLAIHAEVNG